MSELFDTYHKCYMMVIEEPVYHGYTHEYIKSLLDTWDDSQYLTVLFMCDEKVDFTETMRTLVYVLFQHEIPYHVLVFLFPFARVVPVEVSQYEVRNYFKKERNYKNIRAYIEPFPGSFEEWVYTPGVKGGVRRE